MVLRIHLRTHLLKKMSLILDEQGYRDAVRHLDAALDLATPHRDRIRAAFAESVRIRLPDYARVRRFVLAGQPFSVANGLLTGTGRVRREQVEHYYRRAIEDFYREETL